ncbi:MAG TPA: hypothetical protein VFJ59_18815 [Pseudolabrys sp.]|nr:hypothetical protein [Pseudolabrys sp.]
MPTSTNEAITEMIAVRIMLFLLYLADHLIAPASRKLEEEAYEQTLVSAVVVHDGIDPINSTAVLREPFWARSTHVMTFRVVTLDWLDHWRSPSAINCTEDVSTGNTD